VRFINELTVYSWDVHNHDRVQAIPELRIAASVDGGTLEAWVRKLLRTELPDATVCGVKLGSRSVSWYLLFIGFFEGCKLDAGINLADAFAASTNWESNEFKARFRSLARAQFENQKSDFDDVVATLYAEWCTHPENYDPAAALNTVQTRISRKLSELTPPSKRPKLMLPVTKKSVP
jgi:hypothetical protein